MTKIKAVLLDYDDTLVDTYMARLKAAEKAAEGILDPSLDMDSIMKNWAGRPQREIWLDLAGDDDKADALMEGYTHQYWNETNKDIEIFPGVRDLLDELKSKGLAVGMVTSKARLMHDENGPYGVVVEVERLGLEGIFDVVVGWPDVKESKPHPAPILYALDRLNLSPEQAVMVGDSHIDVTAAKRAGVVAVAAKWGTLNERLLIEAGPDHLLEYPSELLSIVS